MNILMINVPYAGHTNPTLQLTEDLVKHEHHVYYINAEEYRKKIEETGANFIPYNDFPEHPSEQQKKTKCFRAAFDTAMTLDRKFDLLIYEMFFYPGIKIAESMNIPCVRQFSQPAWNQQIISSASRLFKFSCVLIDFQVMGKKNADYMKLQHKTLADAVVNDKPDLNIVYVPQVFQKERESFGKDYLFTVPINNSNSLSTEIPYKEMQYPIVYISLGSIISNRGFCKECIRAFAKKDMSVILNTGKIKTESLGKIPDNIYAYSFVPQMEVLQRADVFLTHCGMNSVNEALTLGVPMVAMPFVNDQISNAECITRIGIGKRVRSFPSSGKELYRTVREVSQDECIRKRSKEIQKLVNSEMGMESIIQRIEGLAHKNISEHI